MKSITEILALLAGLTATIYCLNANALESETNKDEDEIAETVDLYLDAPKFEPIAIGDERFYMVDEEGLRQDTIIYRTYQTLGDHTLLLEEELSIMREDARDLETWLGDCRYALTEADQDRQFVYQLRESDLKRHEMKEKKQRLKAILFGAGGGVVALAAGLLIGMFAF